MKIWKRGILPLLLLCAVVLAGCAAQPGEEPTEPAATVTVRFLADGEVVSQQTIAQGACPAAVEPDLAGLVFAGWQDETGQAAAPEQIAVETDTDYAALVYPALNNHVPYLFADENGFIRPDDVLTADELTLAIHMLAEEAAWAYLPSLPSGEIGQYAGTLRWVLEDYFPPEALDAAFAGVEDGPVTRAQFAGIMNRLLGREEETVIVTYGTYPRDLDFNREDCGTVLEACWNHVRSPEGMSWEDTAAELSWEPGFFNLGGWLYYADETGRIVTDTQIGTLTFGSDGRFTSGDGELDAIVAELINGFVLENPAEDQFGLMRTAYLYCRESFTYLHKDTLPFGATGWEIESAKTMLTGKVGNCYNYAGAFWSLARGLGYDAFAVSGGVLRYGAPHGWVGIYFDDVLYGFDPELEMSYRYERGEPNADMFMMEAKRQTYYKYIWP